MIDMTTPFTLTPLKYYATWIIIFVLMVWLLCEIMLHRNANLRVDHFEHEAGKNDKLVHDLQVDVSNVVKELRVTLIDAQRMTDINFVLKQENEELKEKLAVYEKKPGDADKIVVRKHKMKG